jgi:hypothetical protein
MPLKLFGFMDFFAWISLVFFQFGLFKNLLLFFSVYLIIKLLIFFPDLMSAVDGITGIFFIFAFFGMFSFITWVLFLFLMQKSLFTLFI